MLITTFILLISQSSAWTCGGSFTQKEYGPIHSRNLLTRSSSVAAIRLYYHYVNFDLKNDTLNTMFKTTLMSMVDSFFTTTLKVYQIQENLILSSSTCGSVSIPTEHQTTGVPDTDVIVYITTNYLTNVEYVGYAGACEFDRNGKDNVIAGTVVINQPNFKDNPIDSWLAIMTHEMTHMLGFSQGLFDEWKNELGESYAEGTLRKDVVFRGVSKSSIVTKNVLEKARIAFACDSLEALELEDEGGSGTAGSHWDKRVMMNDYMTAYVPTEPIFSNITLALFQDTGWYTVDYTLAQMPYFGRNAGCSFFSDKCVVNSVSQNNNLWCDTYSKWACDSFALNKGGCGVTTYSSALISEFRYFSNDTTGGNDKYTDYCPYKKALSNGSCRGNYLTTFTFKNSYENISQNSRCFESTLMKKPYKMSTSVYAACYEVKSCTDTSVTIQVETQTIVCSFDGASKTLTGYNGLFKCPSSKTVCSDIPCKNMCFARGSCGGLGVCTCFKGYGGDDCYYKCSDHCETCTNSSLCLTCENGYALSNGVCVSGCSNGCSICEASACSQCLQNYFLSSNNCLNCISNCLVCTTSTDCSSCENGYFWTGQACTLCTQNCLTCLTISTCDTCLSGYDLQNGNCIVACGSNCISCANSNTCSQCSSSFYVSTSGSCLSCPSNCLTCTATYCTTCESGYQISGSGCSIICPNNCATCTSNTVCTLCFSGFILNSGSTCECVSGYYLSSGSCMSCGNICTACTSSSVCSQCKTGYYLEISACNQCPNSCLSCTSLSICTLCISNYRLISSLCIQCPSECITCSSDGICTSCVPGYYLSGTLCITCPATCQICTSSECTSCKTGYLLSNGACESCSDNCMLCLTSMNCKGCQISYELLSSSCNTCGSNCGRCRNGVCSQCLRGFYLDQSECKSCPSGCQSCKSSSFCSTCLLSYMKSGNLCIKCLTGCSKCSSSKTCTNCLPGFYFKSRVCLQCADGCKVCKSLEFCYICEFGYSLNSGICSI